MTQFSLAVGEVECSLTTDPDQGLLLIKIGAQTASIDMQPWDIVRVKSMNDELAILCGKNGAMVSSRGLVPIKQGYPISDVIRCSQLPGMIVVTELGLVLHDDDGHELHGVYFDEVVVGRTECLADSILVHFFDGSQRHISYAQLRG
jgi:hypothetical protein